MYLLQCRIRVMLLYQHDKKSWDYWYSYLKPTATTGRTSLLTPPQRSVLYVWTHCYPCVYVYSVCVNWFMCVLFLCTVMFIIFCSQNFKSHHQAVTVKLLWKDLLESHTKLRHVQWTSNQIMSALLWMYCTLGCRTITVDKEWGSACREVKTTTVCRVIH